MRHDGPGAPLTFEGWHTPTNDACQDCVHAFYDPLSAPSDGCCGKYKDKPTNVMFDGASCEFYEYEPNPPDYWKQGDSLEKFRELCKTSRLYVEACQEVKDREKQRARGISYE